VAGESAGGGGEAAAGPLNPARTASGSSRQLTVVRQPVPIMSEDDLLPEVQPSTPHGLKFHRERSKVESTIPVSHRNPSRGVRPLRTQSGVVPRCAAYFLGIQATFIMGLDLVGAGVLDSRTTDVLRKCIARAEDHQRPIEAARVSVAPMDSPAVYRCEVGKQQHRCVVRRFCGFSRRNEKTRLGKMTMPLTPKLKTNGATMTSAKRRYHLHRFGRHGMRGRP